MADTPANPGAGFNPRTREGATEDRGGPQEEGGGFNPRTREGATESLRLMQSCGRVSIHAPVRVRQYHRKDHS